MKNSLQVWAAVCSLYMILFTQMLDTSIAILSLLVISIDLHLDVYQSAGIMTFYGVGLVIAFPMGAFLTKFWSEGLLFIIGCLIFMVTSLACGLAQNSDLFLFFRFIQGIGAGFSVVVCQSLMIKVLGDDKRPLALSLTMSAVTLAPVFGPLIGSIITEYLDWRWLFLSNVPLCAIGVFFVVSYLEFSVKKDEKFQKGYFVSLLLFSVFVSTVQFIFDFGEKFGWFKSFEIQTALAIAMSVAILFYFSNRRETAQIFNFKLLSEPGYGLPTLVLTFGNGLIVSSLVILPIWLQTDYGLSIIQAGLIVSVASALAAVISPMIGKYYPEKYYVPLSLFSVSATACAFFAMSRFSPDTSQEYIVFTRIIAGLGISTFTAPLLTVSFKKLAVEEITKANSLSLTMRLYSANLFITLSLLIWKYKQSELYSSITHGVDRAYIMNALENGITTGFGHIASTLRVDAMSQIMLYFGIAFAIAIIPVGYLKYHFRVEEKATE